LRVVGCGLWIARCGLRVAGCGLRVVGCGLRVVDCALRVAGAWILDAEFLTPDTGLWRLDTRCSIPVI
jgi:hypothetical protein